MSLTLFTYPSEWLFPITQDPLIQLTSTISAFLLIGILSTLTIHAITLAWLTHPAFKQLRFAFFQTPWSKRLRRCEVVILISILILIGASLTISRLDFTFICQFGFLLFIFSVLTRDILVNRQAWQSRHVPAVLASLTTHERRQWSYFNIWSIVSTGLMMLIQVTMFSLIISALPAFTDMIKNTTP
ncbi:hypothetical protein DY78_GL000833 [Lactiplantibacillus fabifermentans DSM 21115]|uniref:Uncharacterized protein n=1 Tax=Lactiplantibacillus fabifermentans DSM 21115 TaxID=1413187 RepID=A0A0R2NLE4_9LACO|nr:hypothetical protein DY78_GL000833 [Lactiplantibacillus fabifermentans DSM 21115]